MDVQEVLFFFLMITFTFTVICNSFFDGGYNGPLMNGAAQQPYPWVIQTISNGQMAPCALDGCAQVTDAPATPPSEKDKTIAGFDVGTIRSAVLGFGITLVVLLVLLVIAIYVQTRSKKVD